MTRNTQTSMYDALKDIAGMMIEDGYTAAEVTAVADGLRQIKSSLWDEEKATGKDLGTKMIGGNAWILDKVAIYMEAYYDDYSRTYEAAAYIDEICADILDPIYNNNDDDDNDDDCRPYYNDDELLAFLGDFAEEYDIDAIRNYVTFYDYQEGRRYWYPQYTDDADALMMVCDRYHLEEFEECPDPALQAEIDEAKRVAEDDEYQAWLDMKANADLIPDEAYKELHDAAWLSVGPIDSGMRLELADGTPTSWTWIDPATFPVSELHEFTAIIDDDGCQGYYAYTAPAAAPDLDAIRNAFPDFAYCESDAPEVIEVQEKLRAADDHTDVDDSWMDRKCYTTIRAKDGGSGQRVDVDPPTWRDKIEMEHQLREDGYEYVTLTTDGPRLVMLWYRPMMPRPMVDSLIKKIEEC